MPARIIISPRRQGSFGKRRILSGNLLPAAVGLDLVGGFAFVFDGEKEDPAVLDEVFDAFVFIEDSGHAFARGLDHDVESEGFVDPLFAVVDGLHGKACLKVADVALADAEGSGDVVGHLVSAAEDLVVYGGGEVLQVDPASDDHRGGEDELQGGFVGVTGVVVIVEKDATTKFGVFGSGPWRGNEGGVAGESPLGADFGPVVGFCPDLAIEGVVFRV